MRSTTPRHDTIVVGAGPNGLAAAITLAQAGRSVLVLEANETIGGGARSAPLTLPGFVHDICSAIHPLAIASPFLRRLPLADYGLTWVQPPAAYAHPLDDGQAIVLERSVWETAATLGADGAAYRRLMTPLVRGWRDLLDDVLGPLPLPPQHPLLLARFGTRAVRTARGLAESQFIDQRARALVAGAAAHTALPLERWPTAAFALVLMTSGHAGGWPLPRGGAQAITDALAAHLRSLGGEIETSRRVASLRELPPARHVLLDLTPDQVLALAGPELPAGYRHALRRYRYGPGVFKLDWALAGPIPWRAATASRAATVHVGGTLAEISAAEQAVAAGRPAERPFVLIAQPSLFDDSRAPAGKHTAWGYCHVPNGYPGDMTTAIEAQVERFAPGFRDLILARHTMTPADMQAHNANYIGGDINGGLQDWRQLFTRPALRINPYATPLPGVYLCSSSTPPGGGVHGMCGWHAAQSVLRHNARRR